MIRALGFSLLCGALLSGCATRPKTYAAPSAARVDASTERLGAAVAKAGETAARAEAKISAAQTSAQKIATGSAELVRQATALEAAAPPDLKPQVQELRARLDAQRAEETLLAASLAAAREEHATLRNDVAEAAAAKAALQKDQAVYQTEARALAQTATEERTARVAAEREITSQKILGWLWKIGGGAVVLALVGGVVLWWTGKLAFKLAV